MPHEARRRSRSLGFTLIELVVVVAILAVLAAIVTPVAATVIKKSKLSRSGADLRSVTDSTLMAYEDLGWVPHENDMGLGNPNIEDTFFLKNSWDFAGWQGPYYRGSSKSPWKLPYRYDNDADKWDGSICNGGGNLFGFVPDCIIGLALDEIIDDGRLDQGLFCNNSCGLINIARSSQNP